MAVAFSSRHKLSVNATIVRRIEAGGAAWLIDDTTSDGAKEISTVAGVLKFFRVRYSSECIYW